MGKSSVSALQEYCAKNLIPLPIYSWIPSEDNSFVCRIQIMDVELDGYGRSKRDAKHMAAAIAIKKLRLCCPGFEAAKNVSEPEVEIPMTDMIMLLRDYCVRNNHPLPSFEIVQQSGTPDGPMFTVLCSLATLKRYGVSEKKKDARQKAAAAMLRVIQTNKYKTQSLSITEMDATIDDQESERYQKFKSYRELTESTTCDQEGLLLCDRHNYFTKFHKSLKQKANEILQTTYESAETKLNDLFKALKIKPQYKSYPSCQGCEKMIAIELNCDFDVYLINLESKIYTDALNYFRDMLI